MNNVSRANVLEAAKGLINKKLEMSVREWLRDRVEAGSTRRLVDTERGESNSQWHAGQLPSAPPGRLEGNIRWRSEMKIGREGSRIDELRQNFHSAQRPDSYHKN